MNPSSKSPTRGCWPSLVLCLVASIYLGACAAAAVGGVLVTSVDIARDRRTVGTYVDDNAVELKIRHAIRQDTEIGGGVHISVTSVNGVVLLTGEVANNAQGRRAVGIARGFTEARQVVNQLVIAPVSTFSNRNFDSWLTTKAKSSLITSRDVSAGDIKVVTERATIYLMGVVTRAEADAAVAALQQLRGVERIVKVFEYI